MKNILKRCLLVRNEIVLDYTKLYNAYKRNTSKRKADPVSLFKVVVYGYMTGHYSCRAIEEACKTNINFMWLLNEADTPDHNTISRFRNKKAREAIEDLFSQLVIKLKDMDEIECKNLFVDGTKIEANANRYSFVWRKTIVKNSEKLAIKMKALLDDLNEKYTRSFSDIYEAFEFLLKQKEKYNVGLFSEYSDQLTLIPFLEDTEEKTGIRYKEIVADAGYESEENYVYLNEHNQDSYIKPSNYKTSKKRNKRPYSTECFIYNAETDSYTCPENQELKPLYIRNAKSKSGYISEKTIYGTCKCESCPNKRLCTKSDKGRTIQRAKVFADFRNKSFENITTPKGIELRMNRSIQVEGAFGVLKQDYGFRRFLTRGKANVSVEMLLLCFASILTSCITRLLRTEEKHIFLKN